MATAALPRRRATAGGGVGPLGLGVASLWLSIIVLLPLAAVFAKSLEGGPGELIDAITAPAARAALLITVGISAVVALIALAPIVSVMTLGVLVRREQRKEA